MFEDPVVELNISMRKAGSNENYEHVPKVKVEIQEWSLWHYVFRVEGWWWGEGNFWFKISNKRLFMSQPITIADLTPKTKGDFILRFEVTKVKAS